ALRRHGRRHRSPHHLHGRQPSADRADHGEPDGPVPLTVSFDGTGSSDPEGKPLSHSWDLDGDGAFGDATGSTASYTYTTAGVYHPTLRVTDHQGAPVEDVVAFGATQRRRPDDCI